jgi:hypothetical protein
MVAKLFLLAGFGAISAFALSGITPNNPSPTDVGAPPGSESSLQSILTSISGEIGTQNVITSQTGVSLWSESGISITPTLQFTFTGATDTIGIFDGATQQEAAIYTGISTCVQPSCQPSDTVVVKWLTATSGWIGSSADPFSGISSSDFGFYLNNGTSTFFSASNLNPSVGTGSANFSCVAAGCPSGTNEPIAGETSTKNRVLSYHSTLGNDLWALAFEDGTDFDYNDQVVTVESITPSVPEPSSVLLFGGALGLAFLAMRRKLQNS